MLRHSFRALAFIALSLVVAQDGARSANWPTLVLVRNGRSNYRIVLPRYASPSDTAAALELQARLRQISGAELRIVQSDLGESVPRIWIGSAGHAEGFPVTIEWSRLEEDGFTIKTIGNDLVIAGGSDKGALNGVYTLLETFLGCRKYSPTVEVIPRRRTITLPTIDITQVPKIKFRDPYFYDPAYMAWHKLDNHDELFGLYVHTFQRLVPPERYFKDHPEYFTMTRGGRIPDAQLCLTNPELFRVLAENLQEQMRQKPEKKFWSVSQNDTFSPCGCDACKAIDSAEGSSSGTLLSFVNRVADQFPDKMISTLAYQYTRSAPKTIRPRDNVNIMLCSIECNRSRPLATDTSSASFRKDVEDWTRLTSNIYLWDYVVQFRNLMSPFPNLRVLQPNIQYFVKNGATMIFEQGSGRLPNEFKELRTYLIAKLLWDPDIDVDSLMNDFLNGYYGKAAPHLRRYIDTMHDALEASGEDLGIYGFPLPSSNGYLSPENMDKYVSFFDAAEQSVRTDSEMLKRVRIARLPLQFALLEQAKIYGTGKRGFYAKGNDGVWRVKQSMSALVDLFYRRCKEFEITALDEIGTTPEAYLASTRKYMESSMHSHLALFKPVTLAVPASPKYHRGEESALTDGLKGLEDFHLNWLGFEGEDMEATVDLGSTQRIKRTQTDFLQDINAWVFLPVSVEFSVSDDGVTFRSISTIRNSIPEDRKGVFSTPFAVELEPTEARFVRVKAVNMKKCPEWHKGAGGLSWIFADEIIVK